MKFIKVSGLIAQAQWLTNWGDSSILLLHPTSGYSEIPVYFEILSEIAEIHVSGIING